MNKALKALFALPVVASLAFAGEAKSDKDLKKVIEDQGIYVETSQKGIVLSGYVDAGYTYGFNSGNNSLGQRFGTDAGVASQQQGDFNVNAFKLALEKPLSDKNELTAGFRADLFIGEDATHILGTTPGDALSTPYLHQAFVQFRAPVGNGIDFKVGKFGTPSGYEVIERPANLNISYGLLWQNLQPLSHTGILASYNLNDQVSFEAGVVNSDWNSADGVNITNTAGASNVGLIGSVNVKAKGGNANIKNTLTYNPDGGRNILANNNGPQAHAGSAFLWDMWGNWAPKFANDKLLLGFNTDFGFYDEFAVGTNATRTNRKFDETFWGAAVYAKYQFTSVFSLAGRAEFIHNSQNAKFGNNGTPILGGPTQFTTTDLWSYTLTAGFNIWENMLLRAEYRIDAGTEVQNNGTEVDDGLSHLASVQVVYSF